MQPPGRMEVRGLKNGPGFIRRCDCRHLTHLRSADLAASAERPYLNVVAFCRNESDGIVYW